jgi:hypothetical protein
LSPRGAFLGLLPNSIALVLLRISKNPAVPCGHVILSKLCLGLASCN